MKQSDYRREQKKLRKIQIAITISGIIISIVLLVGIVQNIAKQNESHKSKENATKQVETEKKEETTAEKKSKTKKKYKISAPKEYTRTQILKFLKQYSDSDENIKYLYENRDNYDTDLLEKVANNPEMAEFIANYFDYESEGKPKLSKNERAAEVPLLIQWDKRWGYKTYGDSNIGLAGCGPTCVSMVVYSLTRNDKVTPVTAAKYSEENGYYVEGIGTAWKLMTTFPAEYGINIHEVGLSKERIESELDNGGLIICAMGPGDFTLSGHFIVIYGYDDNGFKINDPNCITRSKKQWTHDRLATQIKALWGYKLEETRETQK